MSIATRSKLLFRHSIRRATGGGALPDFLILGAQKAGSTSLFNYLCASSRMVPPLRKEVHYFSQYKLADIGWYRSFFPSSGSGTLTGEATPFYLAHPYAARRIAASGITPKLVAILRCPVERAWSHYRHQLRKDREPLEFQAALEAENSRLRETTDEVLDRRHHWALQHQSYLLRGQYMRHLSRYYRIWGTGSVHLLTLDRLKLDPAGAVEECCDFIGLPAPPKDTPYKVYNAGNESADMPDIDRAILRQAFAADLDALATILPDAARWRERLDD